LIGPLRVDRVGNPVSLFDRDLERLGEAVHEAEHMGRGSACSNRSDGVFTSGKLCYSKMASSIPCCAVDGEMAGTAALESG
jgi:hypothetical protein